MTTIACNREIMAGDSLVTCSELTNYRAKKLFRIGGAIFGVSGDNKAIAKFVLWQQSSDKLDRPTFDEFEDLAVLELRGDGIYLWDTDLFPERIEDEQQNYAVGSGNCLALYCMRELDHSPEKAIAETCKIDTMCAPPVRWMKLNGEEGEYKPVVRKAATPQ